MLLQQLLQRNHQNVRQVYFEEKRFKHIFNDQSFQRTKLSNLKPPPQTLKLSHSNLLIYQATSPNLTDQNPQHPKIKGPQFLSILGNQLTINDVNIQRIESIHRLKINKNRRSVSKESQRTYRVQANQQKLHKANLSFCCPNNKITESSMAQRKITTAVTSKQSPKPNILEKGIFDLPDSFTLKTSLKKFNRAHSTLIKYDQNPESGRQQSIHSRGRMRRQEQMIKNTKAKSQQNFYQSDEQFSSPANRLGFLNEFEQVPLEKEQGLHIEVEKINLQQKSIKKNEYVNVLFEYRKSKAKIQKQDFYTPWKKNQKDNKKSVDLAELIQLHNY